MKFSAYQRTEQAGRKDNEDRMGYLYTPEAALFVVADGMGGHANGELAAQITLETMTKAFQAQAHPVIADPREFLIKAVLQSHHEILQFSNDAGMDDSPRTTLVALLIQNGEAMWVHCGDSRLYWVRGNQLQKRTIDHSYAEQTPVGSKHSAEYLSKVVNRNVLFTCLGSSTKPIYDVSPSMKLEPGDKFLLCTDGLWGVMKDADVVETLAVTSIAQSVPRLIDLSMQLAGTYGDNVTAIGVDWQS
jgi:serine/threonine protein phosphatase PrpC